MKLSKAQAKKLGLPVPKRKHKYGAVATTVDGIRFSSKREAKRYSELKLMEKAGTIRWLVRQPVFHLHAQGGKKVCEYVADSEYDERIDDGDDFHWEHVVEDVKGVKTAVYRLKKAWMLAEHGIVIKEI